MPRSRARGPWHSFPQEALGALGAIWRRNPEKLGLEVRESRLRAKSKFTDAGGLVLGRGHCAGTSAVWVVHTMFSMAGLQPLPNRAATSPVEKRNFAIQKTSQTTQRVGPLLQRAALQSENGLVIDWGGTVPKFGVLPGPFWGPDSGPTRPAMPVAAKNSIADRY